jgi:hypothetical protein
MVTPWKGCVDKGFRWKRGGSEQKIDQTTLDWAMIWRTFATCDVKPILTWFLIVWSCLHGDTMEGVMSKQGFFCGKGGELTKKYTKPF